MKISHDYQKALDHPEKPLELGAQVTVIPHITGCQIHPPQAQMEWLGEMNRTEFKVKPVANLPDANVADLREGLISYYVGPVLIAETKFSILISHAHMDHSREEVEARVYQSVFVSYSRKDSALVTQEGGRG